MSDESRIRETLKGGHALNHEDGCTLLGALDAERARANRYDAQGKIIDRRIERLTLALTLAVRELERDKLDLRTGWCCACGTNSNFPCEPECERLNAMSSLRELIGGNTIPVRRVHRADGTVHNVTPYESGFRDALEAAARLCERVRCREWSPKECAAQIRDPANIPIPTRANVSAPVSSSPAPDAGPFNPDLRLAFGNADPACAPSLPVGVTTIVTMTRPNLTPSRTAAEERNDAAAWFRSEECAKDCGGPLSPNPDYVTTYKLRELILRGAHVGFADRMRTRDQAHFDQKAKL